MATIQSNYGPVMVTQPGQLTQSNAAGVYVPGQGYLIKGKELKKFGDVVTPYQVTAKLLEKNDDFAFVEIDTGNYFVFAITINESGNEVITTGRTYMPGFTTDREKVYQSYLQKIADLKAERENKIKQAAAVKEAAQARAEREARICKVKELKNKALIELKAAVAGKKIDGILLDAEICEIVDRFYMYELVLKAM